MISEEWFGGGTVLTNTRGYTNSSMLKNIWFTVRKMIYTWWIFPIFVSLQEGTIWLFNIAMENPS